MDRTAVIMKSRYLMSGVLGISSDYLYDSVQRVSYASEKGSSYDMSDGQNALMGIYEILDQSDELFNQLIELREIAKRNILIEKILCQELLDDVAIT